MGICLPPCQYCLCNPWPSASIRGPAAHVSRTARSLSFSGAATLESRKEYVMKLSPFARSPPAFCSRFALPPPLPNRDRRPRGRLLLGHGKRVRACERRHRRRVGLCRRQRSGREYDKVSSEGTGHAEAVRITYDPAQISYAKLLQIYFTVAHDPTQVNRQGPDVGPSYRSAIFPQSPAAGSIRQGVHRAGSSAAHVYKAPIATQDRARRLLPGRSLSPGLRAKAPLLPVHRRSTTVRRSLR